MQDLKNNHQPLSSNNQISPASTEQSPVIFRILNSAFEERFLQYTIFQSPKTIKYIEHLISHEVQKSKFFTLIQNNDILGFYYAEGNADVFHLKYISVIPEKQGKGFGNSLLTHFEELGREYQYNDLTVDVHSTNNLAFNWYVNKGYRVVSEQFSIRIDLDKFKVHNNCVLSWNKNDMKTAMQQEQRWGFSLVMCHYGKYNFRLGMIAGHQCTIMDHNNLPLYEVGCAISSLFPSRNVGIINSLSKIPDRLPILSKEKIFRLRKHINY